MATLTITLSSDQYAQLQQIAQRFNVTPEDLARVSIRELLAQPDQAFQQALAYVLEKNAELYKRLA